MGNCSPVNTQGEQMVASQGHSSKQAPFGAGNPSKNMKLNGDDLNRWISIPQIGQIPGKRSGHAVVTVGNKAYHFGGCGDDSECLDHHCSFDFNTHCWKRLRANGQHPKPRASFEFAPGPVEGTIILGGGTARDGLHGDIFEYNIYTRQWKQLVFEEGKEILQEFLSAYGQTMRTYQNYMVGFGGSSGTSYTDAVIKINISTLKCEKLTTTGSIPSARYKHQSIISNGQMFIIGGGNYRPRPDLMDLYSLNLETLKWTEHAATGQGPTGRVAHVAVHDAFANCVYTWGGFNENLERLNDFHRLDLSAMQWSPIRCEGPIPPARAFHSAVFWNSTVYIFGGADGETRFEDLWAFRFRTSPPSLMLLAAKSPSISRLATPIATPTECRSRCASATAINLHDLTIHATLTAGGRRRTGSNYSASTSPKNQDSKPPSPRNKAASPRNREKPPTPGARSRTHSRTPSQVTGRHEIANQTIMETSPPQMELEEMWDEETAGHLEVTEERPGLITVDVIMQARLDAFYDEKVGPDEEQETFKRSRQNSYTGRHRAFSSHRAPLGFKSDDSRVPVEFVIPGEGIVPSEILTGIQFAEFGADNFSNSLPQESRPHIPVHDLSPQPRNDAVQVQPSNGSSGFTPFA